MSGPGEKIKSLKSSASLHLILIAILGLIVYSNTFDVPFHFDDKRIIVKNPVVKNLEYFFHPEEAGALPGSQSYKGRLVGYLTFALNYKVHGLDLFGYHMTNLFIHMINAFFVYLIVILTFKSPRMKESALAAKSSYIALLSALFFISHPVQTQAVTYIAQRFASLATLFYLASLSAYVGSRLSGGKAKRGVYYALSLAAAVLAMKTKQVALTLPLAIALYEYIFFDGGLRKRFLYLVPLLLTMIIIPLSLLTLALPAGEIMKDMEDMTRIQDMSRVDYLLTEFRVIVTYIRLLILPMGQNLDYDYPIYHSFFDYQVLLSFLFLLSLLAFGVYLLRRSCVAEQASRLVAFGIFWFFITLSVESSLIPLHVIFEHRVYLPSAGAFWALGTGAVLLTERFKTGRMRHIAVSFAVLSLILLSCATYARNTIWRSEATLWEDTTKKSPQKARPHVNLGNALLSEGKIDEAIKHYETAAKLEPDLAEAYNNLGGAFYSKGQSDKAMEYFRIAIKLDPDYAEAFMNLGVYYSSQGLVDKAIEHFQTALKLNPIYVKAHHNLGVAYDAMGLTDKALEHLQTAVRLMPDDVEAHINIGNAYESKGMTDKAVEHFQIALKLEPGNEVAHYNLGNAFRNKGLLDKAIESYKIALRLKPDYVEAHINISSAYRDGGMTDKAVEHLETALKLEPDNVAAHFNIGNAYRAGGQLDRAIESYRTALGLKPDYVEAHNNLAAVYMSMGSVDKAIEHFQTAIRIRPDHAGSCYNLGLIYLKQGLQDKARRELQTALKINPDFHEARQLLERINK